MAALAVEVVHHGKCTGRAIPRRTSAEGSRHTAAGLPLNGLSVNASTCSTGTDRGAPAAAISRDEKVHNLSRCSIHIMGKGVLLGALDEGTSSARFTVGGLGCLLCAGYRWQLARAPQSAVLTSLRPSCLTNLRCCCAARFGSSTQPASRSWPAVSRRLSCCIPRKGKTRRPDVRIADVVGKCLQPPSSRSSSPASPLLTSPPSPSNQPHPRLLVSADGWSRTR